jgi:hypothetical protein
VLRVPAAVIAELGGFERVGGVVLGHLKSEAALPNPLVPDAAPPSLLTTS